MRVMHQDYPQIEVILVTAVNDAATAVETMKLGASDYIVKPFDLDIIDATVRTVLVHQQLSSAGNARQATGDIDNRGLDTPAIPHTLQQINAIARGVEARVQIDSDYSETVIARTTSIARQLGISEVDIHAWANARLEAATRESQRIISLVSKLERNPLDQAILGLTVELPVDDSTSRHNDN